MNNKYEQEIDLKKLFFYIMRKWRIIILFALVGLILLGGFKFTKAFLTQRDQAYVVKVQGQYDKDLKEYKTLKAGYERTIKTLTSNIEFEEQYESNSVLFNIDSNNKWVASADVFIKMKESDNSTLITVDPADSIVKAYKSVIDNGSFLEHISKKMEIDIPFIRELIGVEKDNEGNMLSISITYKDEEGAKEIINTILETLDSSYTQVSDGLGEHSIIIMNRNIGMEIDQELAASQKKKVEDLEVMRKKLDEVQNALDELQKPQEPSTLSMKGSIKIGIKFCIIGAIIGGFVTIFIYCIIYVINSKLHATEELKNRFNLKILGAFTQERKKRLFSQVDKLIDKLERIECNSKESVYQRIVANISNYTKNGQTILVTGTGNQEEIRSVVDNLRQMIPELEFITGMNMNKNSETLTKILKVDGVILLEQVGTSRYSDILEEIETINSLNKKIIGCITT